MFEHNFNKEAKEDSHGVTFKEFKKAVNTTETQLKMMADLKKADKTDKFTTYIQEPQDSDLAEEDMHGKGRRFFVPPRF